MMRKVLGYCAVSALCSVMLGSPAAGNLLVNPSFEDGGGSYNGWFTFGSGPNIAVAGDMDDIYREGIASAKIFGEFSGCPNFPQFDVGGFGQAFTPTTGTVYQLGGYAYVSGADPIPGMDTCGGNRLVAKIAFFDAPAGGNEISGNEVVVADWSTVVNQWNPFSVETVAPAGAQRVEALFLFLQPGCDPGAVFVDDCVFQALPAEPPAANLVTNPSFNSSLTGWTSFGNVFHVSAAYEVRTPPGAAKLFSTFNPGSDSGLSQSFPASGGNVWRLDLYAMTTCQNGDEITGDNDNFALARIVFRDGQGAEIGAGEEVILDASAPLGTYTRHTIFADAPPATSSAEIFILFVSPTQQGGAMFVDDVSFREVDPVTETPLVPDAQGFALGQNVPNPFNPTTRIEFALASAGSVDLSIYDVTGRRVATLVRDELSSGVHAVTWHGTTDAGAPAASGIYRYVLTTPNGQSSRSMQLLK